MKTKKLLLTAGFILAGLTAAGAESAFEATKSGPKGQTAQSERQILQLSVTPKTSARRATKRALPTHSDVSRTRNSGFARGYTTFEVLDSIR